MSSPDSTSDDFGLTGEDFAKISAFMSGSKRSSDLGATSTSGRGKISETDCRDIQARSPEASLQSLADEYGVSCSSISRHRRGVCSHDTEGIGAVGSLTKSELITELRRLTDELGRTPTHIEMNDLGEYSPTTYQRHFGSWSNAVQRIERPAPSNPTSSDVGAD